MPRYIRPTVPRSDPSASPNQCKACGRACEAARCKPCRDRTNNLVSCLGFVANNPAMRNDALEAMDRRLASASPDEAAAMQKLLGALMRRYGLARQGAA